MFIFCLNLDCERYNIVVCLSTVLIDQIPDHFASFDVENISALLVSYQVTFAVAKFDEFVIYCDVNRVNVFIKGSISFAPVPKVGNAPGLFLL